MFVLDQKLCSWMMHSFGGHYMRDRGSDLTPILQGRAGFLEMWWPDFLVIRVCYVSRSTTLKSWVSKRVYCWFLSTATKRTYSKRVEIARIWWNMTGYRIFHMNILTLSKIWGQRTDGPWNSAYAHTFSFFLASRVEIVKWISRLQVLYAWYTVVSKL